MDDLTQGEQETAEQEEQQITKLPKGIDASKLFSNPYLSRPARRQVKKGTGPMRAEFTHHSSEYNIWYHKKLGDRFTKEERVKAPTRCCVSTDSGYTRADLSKKPSYCCLYFARGHCVNGAECNYYHRIPTEEDDRRLDLTHDIFGRERHRTYREDMGGVGSFMRDNRTLYITGMKRTANTDELIKRHFAEWGEMEAAKILWDKSIAFVKYRLRAVAEFAKEAMSDQSLEMDEVLNIRWSNEDPFPSNKEDGELGIEQRKLLAAKQREIEPVYQYGTEGANTLDNFPSESNPTLYPNTDVQYEPSYSDSVKFITDWLAPMGLEKYKDTFLSAGLFDPTQLSQLDEATFDAMGITDDEHRALLMEASKKLEVHLAGYYYQQYYGFNPYDQYTSTDTTTQAEYPDQDKPLDQIGAHKRGIDAVSAQLTATTKKTKVSKEQTPSNPLVDYEEDQ